MFVPLVNVIRVRLGVLSFRRRLIEVIIARKGS